MRKSFYLLGFSLLLLLTIVSKSQVWQLDFTQDQRYSLSKMSQSTLQKLEERVDITVYLKGDFPASFQQFSDEVRFTLDELAQESSYFTYQFVDPSQNPILEAELRERDILPSFINLEEKGSYKEIKVYPFAVLNYKGRKQTIGLLTEKQGISAEEQLNLSVEDLEYKFMQPIITLGKPLKKVGILTHHEELKPLYLNGFLSKASENYDLAPFFPINQKSLTKTDAKALNQLDALVIAKPIQPFTEEEKIVLDQYIMQGGKTLWFLENVDAEMDSLYHSNQIISFTRDHNLTDLLFHYGIRIKPLLIKSTAATPLKVATGKTGGNTQYSNFNWPYFPLAFPSEGHPITKGINPVKTEFANPIDTIKNNLQKTVLLQTAGKNQLQKPLTAISLKGINHLDYSGYNKGPQIISVLVEGEFQSAYKDRLASQEFPGFKEKSESNKLLVVSDGDVIKNQVQKGRPLPLGFDKWTQVTYGNESFVLHALQYLLDDTALSELRNKKFQIQALDLKKLVDHYSLIRLLVLFLPLLLIGGLAFLGLQIRKNKFSH